MVEWWTTLFLNEMSYLSGDCVAQNIGLVANLLVQISQLGLL